jgi:hypothetical protein
MKSLLTHGGVKKDICKYVRKINHLLVFLGRLVANGEQGVKRSAWEVSKIPPPVSRHARC